MWPEINATLSQKWCEINVTLSQKWLPPFEHTNEQHSTWQNFPSSGQVFREIFWNHSLECVQNIWRKENHNGTVQVSHFFSLLNKSKNMCFFLKSKIIVIELLMKVLRMPPYLSAVFPLTFRVYTVNILYCTQMFTNNLSHLEICIIDQVGHGHVLQLGQPPEHAHLLHTHCYRKVWADFAVWDWWRYCKARKLSQIEGNGRKFSHIEQSNM